MSVTGAHSRPHCVPGHIAPTAPMIGMVQKHRNYKNNVVKKKMEEERFSAKTFISECRNPFAEIFGFPRMDFREWIFKVGIDKAENEPRQVAENCYSLR